MSLTGALELGLAVAKEHQSGSGAIHLISVLDSELELNHEVYDAVLRRLGGVYIRVDKRSDLRVAGTLDNRLRDSITQILQSSALAPSVEIIQDGRDVVVRRSDGVDPVNHSERVVLQFIAVLFSEELSRHSLVAISFTESVLDKLAKESLWRVIRTQVGVRRPGSLRTLVFIAGGVVDPEFHCEHDASVTFALTESGLSRRKARISLEAAVGKLTRETTRPIVLFLGAGASASARMPLGDAVRDFALEQFFSGTVAPTEMAKRFYEWVRDNNRLLALEEGMTADAFVERLTLERVLREEFHVDGREASPTLKHLQAQNGNAVSHKKTRMRSALRQIIEAPNRLVLVTVNFDTILEDEFPDELEVFAGHDAFRGALSYLKEYLDRGGGKVPLLKLHGTLDLPESIVADVDTRSLGLSGDAADSLRLLRGSPTAPTPWVYVGASMRDPDVTEIIGESSFADRLEELWVSPFPDNAVASFAREHRIPRWLESRRAGLDLRQITETADVFMTALAARWPVR